MMYRCGQCDAPALMNCSCYTQLEGTIQTEALLPVPVRHPSEQAAALKRAANNVVELRPWKNKHLPLQQHPDFQKKLDESLRKAKMNISSGEDAQSGHYIVEYVE